MKKDEGRLYVRAEMLALCLLQRPEEILEGKPLPVDLGQYKSLYDEHVLPLVTETWSGKNDNDWKWGFVDKVTDYCLDNLPNDDFADALMDALEHLVDDVFKIPDPSAAEGVSNKYNPDRVLAVGATIEEALEHRGYTLQQVASEYGLDYGTLLCQMDMEDPEPLSESFLAALEDLGLPRKLLEKLEKNYVDWRNSRM